MTLIVTVATKHLVGQVADTLLTNPDGTPYDDRAVKMIIVHCRDAKVTVSYSGLAFIGHRRMDNWLVASIKQLEPRDRGFIRVVEFLRDRLNGALRTNRSLERYGLTLTFAALGLKQRGVVVVTNCEKPQAQGLDLDNISPQGQPFKDYRFIRDSKDIKLIAVSGAIGADLKFSGVRRKIWRRLHKIKTKSEFEGLLKALVNMIRLHRTSRDVGHLIGENCTGVVIGSDFKSTSYSYSKDRRKQIFPNIVGEGFSVEDLMLTFKPGSVLR